MPVDYCTNILNNVVNCPSHFSPGIQLADFVAHSVWKKRERDISAYYDKLDPYWERNGSETYYDSIIPG